MSPPINRARDISCAVAAAAFSAAGLSLPACQKSTGVLAAPTAAAGQTQVIEAGGGGDVGWWPQIAFDTHDRAHIAYCDARTGLLRYGVETAAGWALVSVAPPGSSAGKYISLALRDDDRVGITYTNASTHYFDYATRAPSDANWHIEHVAFGAEAGMASVLRYSADGRAHVLYYLSSGKLVYASREKEPEGVWTKTEVGPYQAVYSARIGAVAEPEGLWFSYVNWQLDAATLYIAHLDGQGWQPRVVPTERSSGWRSQLARVGDDLWVVHSQSRTNSTAIRFLDRDSQWHSLPLFSGGTNFAVAVYDRRGVVAFAKRHASHKSLYLTRQTDKGLWPVEQLAADIGSDPDIAMAIDSQGRVIVLYTDQTIRGLRSYTTKLAPIIRGKQQ